jgi:membrane fusion protein (multidrug efflux system)
MAAMMHGTMKVGTLALALLLFACGDGEKHDKDEDGPRSDARTLVEVVPVSRGTVGDTLTANGSVESVAEANLTPETTGTVVEIRVEEGDRVYKGQVLAVLANPNLDANLSRAQAAVEHERMVELFRQGAVSDTELQASQHALVTSRTSLEEAERTQGFTRLVSPIRGTVSVRDLRYGEVAGGQRAFQVVDLSRLRVVVLMPERDLPRLAVDQPVTLKSVYEDGGSATARVARIAPVVDATTGTVRVTLLVDSKGNALRPGQFVSVRIEVGRHEDVLVIPRTALRYEEGRPLVYRVEIREPEEEEEDDEEKSKDDKKEPDYPGPHRVARTVPIEIGFMDPLWVEVVSGLAEGDPVVTLGNEGLRDDVRVRLPDDPVLASAEDDDPE